MGNFEDIEHFAILLGIIATLFGLFKGLNGWRRARDEAIVARVRQQDSIDAIAAEFKPRNGQTMAQVVAETNKDLKEHCTAAEVWFSNNDDAHRDIHRRIDGLFELFGTPTTARKTAERHTTAREEPQ
jgi:hypothetical protein